MANKKVKLITGGAGFLGLALAKKLAVNGERVRIFDLREDITFKNKNVEFFHGDITKYNHVYKSTKDVDVIFNLASLLPCSRAGDNFIKVNVGGTENVLLAAKQRGIKKIIHISSSIVYGIPEKVPLDEKSRTTPIGNYGKTKIKAEKVCESYMKKGMTIAIIRPRMIIGAGRLGLLTILFDWIKSGKKIYLIGDGKNRFQMVGIDDLVDACILVMKQGRKGIFNIGADNTPLLIDLMKNTIKHANSKSKVVPLNSFIVRNILLILDFFKLTPLNIEHYMIADKDYVLDTKKAKKILGWYPKQNALDFMNEAYDYYIKNKGKLPKGSPTDFPKQKLLKVIGFFS